MNDNQLYAAIIAAIKKGLIDCGFSGIAVKQANQPTQQGANSGPTCYVTKLGNKLYGSPERKDEYNPITRVSDHAEKQYYESQFQLTALAMQSPSAVNGWTADDILQGAIYGLQSDYGIKALKAAGIGVLRITDSTNPSFQDDERRNEFSPSFTFTVTHERVIVSTTPPVETYDYRINRV